MRGRAMIQRARRRASPGAWTLVLIGGGLFISGAVLRITGYPEGIALTLIGMLLVLSGNLLNMSQRRSRRR